jgi:hypothetical protein
MASSWPGRRRLRDGKTKEAADYFGIAGVLGDDPGVISERTFTALLLSGEVTRAAMVAPRGDDATEAVKRLGSLTRVVELLASGKGKEAQTLLKAEQIGFPHRQATTLLGPGSPPPPVTPRARSSSRSFRTTVWCSISASWARRASMSAPAAMTRPRPTTRR